MPVMKEEIKPKSKERAAVFIKAAMEALDHLGGSLRDVQQLVGHASLATTQRYIEGNTEAKRKLVNLI